MIDRRSPFRPGRRSRLAHRLPITTHFVSSPINRIHLRPPDRHFHRLSSLSNPRRQPHRLSPRHPRRHPCRHTTPSTLASSIPFPVTSIPSITPSTSRHPRRQSWQVSSRSRAPVSSPPHLLYPRGPASSLPYLAGVPAPRRTRALISLCPCIYHG
jgi:hypothetical protein